LGHEIYVPNLQWRQDFSALQIKINMSDRLHGVGMEKCSVRFAKLTQRDPGW
jgi:hypothetical protein